LIFVPVVFSLVHKREAKPAPSETLQHA
jgi:hypothetical protein